MKYIYTRSVCIYTFCRKCGRNIRFNVLSVQTTKGSNYNKKGTNCASWRVENAWRDRELETARWRVCPSSVLSAERWKYLWKCFFFFSLSLSLFFFF